MSEEKKTENTPEERQFRIDIWFDKPEATLFGSLTNTHLALVLGESQKDKVLEQFFKQEGVLTITMSDGKVRHLNSKNILIIDEEEIVEKVETN